MLSYVYKITNLINNKLYVGKSDHPEERWKQHLKKSNQDPNDPATKNFYPIHHAIKKYGQDNFIFEIIEELETSQLAFEKEVYYIDILNSHISKNGYNMSFGGEGNRGYKPSEETLIKKSQLMKGKLVGEKNGMYGKHHTEETKLLLSSFFKQKYQKDGHHLLGTNISDEHKEKISIALTNRIMTDEHKEKIGKSQIGKIISQETREKLSQANKGNGSAENNPNAKLSNEDVKKIKQLIKNKEKIDNITKMFSISRTTYYRIKNNECWKGIE